MATNSSAIEDPVEYQLFSVCILAPCMDKLIPLWTIKIRIKLILVSFIVGYAILRRFFPSYNRVRLSDMYLYFFGITGQTSQVSRRELWILILYGLMFHNMLNVLNTHQMAFKTVSIERNCYQTIQETLDADLLIMASLDLEPYLSNALNPTYYDRLVLTNFAKPDLKSKRYAYLMSCHVARSISKTAANYDQRAGQFMMAPIEEPIGTLILPSILKFLGPAFVPETGLLQFLQQKVIYDEYHSVRISRTSACLEKNSPLRSSLLEVVWTWYVASLVIFVLEHVVHRIKEAKRSNNKVHPRKTHNARTRKRACSESHLSVKFRLERRCGYETV